MIKVDLHTHTIYSSYPLYMRNRRIMGKLKVLYRKEDFFEGRLWWAEFLLLDGLISPEEVLKLAQKRGLGAVAITDHNTLLGTLETQRLSNKYRIVVIPAMEVSSLEGEILAYGIKEKIPMHLSAEKTVELIHAQGGVAIASHPFAPKHKNQDFARLDEKLIRSLDLDGIETFSPLHGEVGYWKELAMELGLAEIGGSDAHVPALVGSVWTEFPNRCKTVKDFIEAIKGKETKPWGVTQRSTVLVKAFLEYVYRNTLGRISLPRLFAQ